MGIKQKLLKKALNSLDFDSIKSYSKERLMLIQEDIRERFACHAEAMALLYDAIKNFESLGDDIVVEEIDALANDEIAVTEMYQH